MKKVKVYFLIIVLLASNPSSGLTAPMPGGGIQKKDSSYRFVDHLPNAEAVLLYDDKEGVVGNWTGASFSFPGVKIDSPVKDASLIINEVTYKGIRVVPVPKAITQLRFKDVPPRAKLVLYYGGSKEAFVKGPAYFYLQIWVGSHRLKKTRISADDGWKKDIIDLGVLPFITSDVTMSYLISSDEPSGVRFTIIPELVL